MRRFCICLLWLSLLGTPLAWAGDTARQCQQLYEQKQYKAAFSVCKQASEQGDTEAQINLATMYSNGLGVRLDYAEAVKWYRKAAEHGDAISQFILGVAYATGQGIKKDYVKAAKWYHKAAEQGYANAQNILGVAYQKGQGVRLDYAEAVKWYRKAAEHGDAEAQSNLCVMYRDGKGVRQDYAEAVKWCRKAAEQGYANAQLNLGGLYEYGQGVRQDFVEAVKWFRKASEQGQAKSQVNLGIMYYDGRGVQQDYEEAVKWFRSAAKQGIAQAQFNLGAAHQNGQGVMQSGAAATDWYYKAGISFLKEGNKDMALTSVERIKNLSRVLRLTVPNAFLADKLLVRIYGSGVQSGAPQTKQGRKFKAKRQVAFGTGWPVAGGFVVTNHHVIAGHKKIVLLRQDGVKISGVVAMDDATNDLVLIRVKDASQLPPALPLATKMAHAGARVFTIGYPHPDFMGSEPKVTDGLISAVTGLGNDPRTYQISVPIQAGNSGGPLLNMNGEVVGITASKLSAAKIFKWTGDLPQNVNYAIKTGYLTMLLSSVPSSHKIPVLPARAGNVEQLAARIEKSVLIVVAQ